MPKVMILKGLPASGKSTLARSMVKSIEDTVIISKDKIRETIKSEIEVLKTRDFLITAAIRDNKNVIVDDTNLDPKHEVRIRELVGDDASVTVIPLDISPHECVQRDRERENSVGREVIYSMYYKYLGNRS